MIENDINSQQHNRKPYWKRAHRSITFWIFVFLMFTGIVYYIVSLDFAFAPRTTSNPRTEHTIVP